MPAPFLLAVMTCLVAEDEDSPLAIASNYLSNASGLEMEGTVKVSDREARIVCTSYLVCFIKLG